MAAEQGVPRGAHMSTKWLARMAREGRGLTVVMPGPMTATGFLVGMDDYHLKIAQIVNDEVVVGLAHKSAGFISEAPGLLLSKQDAKIQEKVNQIGQPFWAVCSVKLFGKSSFEESL